MRSKFHLIVLLSIVFLIITGCSSSADKPASADAEKTVTVDTEKLKPEIQAMEDAYAAAEKSKDADKVMAYYSDDAISYGRNRMPESGKTAIKESLVKRLAADTSGNSNVYKVVDLFSEGNMLVEIGSWTEMNAAGAEVSKGHYMSYFQKRDGKWVCVRDMNVTSSPAK